MCSPRFGHWCGPGILPPGLVLAEPAAARECHERVWGSSPNDVWAVGDAGTILHWDGTAWLDSSVSGHPDGFLNVWGSGPSDVWAVGFRNGTGPIFHWDGTNWQRVFTAPRVLEGIWGTGPMDVWASGGVSGSEVNGILLHFDGTEWTEVEVPGGLPMMHAIWGTSSNDVYVGGRFRWIHWDGSTWSNLELPEPMEIFGMWGSDTNNVWTAGFAGALGSAGRVAHWDGQSVSITHLGDASWTCERIWGSQPNDIWVTVGSPGTVAYLYRWDGATWNLVDAGSGIGFLEGISGTAFDDIWAVGLSGLMLHWTGSSWRSYRENPAGLEDAFGVRGNSADDVWAAGTSGTLAHWDGSQWLPVESGTNHTIEALSGNGSDHVWAVGAFDAQGMLVLHWDGNGWSRSPTPAGNNNLHGVWSLSEDDAWAVGTRAALHWDGGAWSAVDIALPPPFNFLNAVWARTSNDVWVTNFIGSIIHWDGVAFTQVFDGTDIGLYGVWGYQDDIWAVGSLGTVLHRSAR